MLNHVMNQTRSGESGGKINCYLNLVPTPEVLIMGSSRAAGNIDPEMFEKSTFNLAHNGMYDVFQLNLLNILIERNKKPDYILYHIDLLHFDQASDMKTMERISTEGIKIVLQPIKIC